MQRSQVHAPRVVHVVVVALLVTALAGGGAAAAEISRNAIGSPQIRDGAVKGKDVMDGSLYGADVRDGSLSGLDVGDGSLTGADVGPDSLTGTDINESTLTLPAAAAVVEGPVAEGTLTGSAVVLASATLTAPADGFVRISGGATFNAISAESRFLGAEVQQDGAAVNLSYWEAGDTDAAFDMHQTVDGVVPVTRGQHTYQLAVYESLTSGSSYSLYRQAQVTVEYFPQGAAGVGSATLGGQVPSSAGPP